MALKKYVVFSWSRAVPMSELIEHPVEEMLGTCDERFLPEDALPGREVEVLGLDGEITWSTSDTEMKLVNARVQMPENMMQGKDYLMKVYTSQWKGGSPHAILAYYEIPRGEA